MEPDIGTVEPIGSVSVSPGDTTAYTLTAIGPGGSATDSVTITVTQSNPVVNIIAEPDTINIGESTTLNWTSQHADTCTIDHGIGSVSLSGSMPVIPVETTTYTIVASSPTGQATATTSVTVVPIGISITSPANNDTITRPDVMVKGVITNPLGNEVGVSINGVIAHVDGNTFVAGHVPLEAGENILTAIAKDADANSSSESIAVNSSSAEDFIRITAYAESGVSPFETKPKIDGSFTFVAQSPDYTGPGTVDIENGSEENEFLVSMTTPGIYYFSSKVELEGIYYTDTVAVCVVDKDVLDSLLQGKWNTMKQFLIDGDIEKALAFHQVAVYDKYLAIYNALGSELPTLVQQMKEISPIFFDDVLVKYRIMQDHDVEGQTVTEF